MTFSESGIPLRKEVCLRGCYCYFLYCLLWAFAVKAIISFFIAATHYKDLKKEHPEASYWPRYLDCWNGVTVTSKHYDLWLPFIIGFAELCAYPILMAARQFEAIGWWIAIKTAGSWRGWQRQRTSYYRFLLGNALVLAISYLFLMQYVTICK